MSDAASLRLHKLHVRKTPGIPDPFLLEGFCGGINLIYGPNSSGKSSTARAIEAVLWPAIDSGRRLRVAALYSLGQSHFHVDLDDGHLNVQCNGVTASAPELPAPEFRHRYQLALHDLLLASEQGDRFAKEIARQSVGGYDFPKAAETLKYREKPSASTAALQALNEARRRLKEATQQQEKLYAQAQRLGELEALTYEASGAQAQERMLAKAVKHAQLAAACETARFRLAGFPSVLGRVRGDEITSFEKLEVALAAAAANEAAEYELAIAAEAVASSAMPHGPLALEAIIGLRERAAAWAEAERRVGEAERRVRDAEAQVAEARQAIGASVNDAQLHAIDGESFDDLAAFARDADQLEGRKAGADAELRIAAEESTPKPSVSPDVLVAGTRLLVHWLREGGSAPGDSDASRKAVLGWCLSAVAVGGWVVAALTWHPVAWLGVPLVMAIAALVLRRDRAGHDSRALRERDYVALGLELPKRWGTNEVITQLDALQQLVANARLAERRTQWVVDARGRRAALEPDLAKLDARRTALAKRLGVAPEGDARRLAWIAEQITGWRSASRLLRGAEGELAQAREQQHATQLRVTEAAGQAGFASPSCADDALALATAVAEKQREYEQATERAAEARAREQKAASERQQLGAAIQRILESCECEAGDIAQLRALCLRHPDYAEASRAAELAERDREMARVDLESDDLFESEFLALDAGELEVRRQHAADLAGQFESRVKEQTELSTTVNQAKMQNDIEQLLAAVTAAEETLQGLRRRDLRAMLGHVLATQVQQRMRNQHRPAVFHRASDLFAKITRGAYSLEFQANDDLSAFRAKDVGTDSVHALGELSTATRIQLLLAVRVAFVEAQEKGVKLPIFLDETLGTTDDSRAGAIIETVMTLAEEGRQVFYLTAQREEVAKWAAALDAREVEYRTFNMSEIRKISGELPIELPLAPLPIPVEILDAPVPPDGHTHESYGCALAVPPVRPGVGSAAGAHLWYLIDELPALHHFLDSGVATWGALENLVQNGGAKELAHWPHVYVGARAKARALDVMHERARLGRGRLIDRQALLESGAVSVGKMDEVLKVAMRYHGSASQILAALERKEVSGFGPAKLDKFRGFLEREGYIDEQLPCSPEEIKAAMLAVVVSEVHEEGTAHAAVDELLRCIELRSTPVSTAAVDYSQAFALTPMTPPANELQS